MGWIIPNRWAAQTGGLADAINDFVDWLVQDYGFVFEAIATVLLQVLLTVDTLFRVAPWWLLAAALAAAPLLLFRERRRRLWGFGLVAVLALGFALTSLDQRVPETIMWLSVPTAVGLAAWLASRRALLAAGLVAALLVVRWLGLWDLAMQSVALTVAALVVSTVLGLPLGIASGVSQRFRTGMRPVLDLMQTMPSFVYLIPALMLFGLGKVPALLATLIYAAPPLVRLTDHGIRTADPAAVEAAEAFGATRWQRLVKVELPLALPSILQGLNQTTMLALSMVVIASMIGARGLGEEVLLGIQRLDVGRGVLAGTAIVLLAIVLDRLTQSVGAAADPMRGSGK